MHTGMGQVCRINTSPGNRAKGFAVCVPVGVVRPLSSWSLVVSSLSSCQSNWKSLWRSWQCVQISVLPSTVSGCFSRFTIMGFQPALFPHLFLELFCCCNTSLAGKTQVWRVHLVFRSRDEGLQLCCGPWLCCTSYITMLEEAHTVAVSQSLFFFQPHTSILAPQCSSSFSCSISDSSANAASELQPQSSGMSEEIVPKPA